jgi:glycosyltransferase involved in cell wall biosynthesis
VQFAKSARRVDPHDPPTPEPEVDVPFPRKALRHDAVRRLLRFAVSGGGWNETWVGDSRAKKGFLWRQPWLESFLSELSETDDRSILQAFSALRGEGSASTVPAHSGAIPDLVDACGQNLDLAGRAVDRNIAASSTRPSFSLVIPFARHLGFFSACLRSVAALKLPGSARPFQVLIANDDPRVRDQELLEAAPKQIRDRLELAPHRPGSGISVALNAAISRVKNDWVIFLDCDDVIEPDALVQLRKHIRTHLRVRYISSCIIDIDAEDQVLRYRRRTNSGPSTMLHSGMHAGHLKSIRRDAFEQYGTFNAACDGAQDYEFALRMGFFEPLLFIPEYLYRYRFHTRTFSLSQGLQQDAVANRIVRTYKCAAMIDAGLLSGESGISMKFCGLHAAEWGSVFEKNRAAGGPALLEISTKDLQPTPRNRRLLILEVAYRLMQFGRVPWDSPFEIRET